MTLSALAPCSCQKTGNHSKKEHHVEHDEVKTIFLYLRILCGERSNSDNLLEGVFLLA